MIPEWWKKLQIFKIYGTFTKNEGTVWNTKEPPVLTIMHCQKHWQASIKYIKCITYIYNCPTVIPQMKDTYTCKYVELIFLKI